MEMNKINNKKIFWNKKRAVVSIIILALIAALIGGISIYWKYTNTHYTVTVYLMRHGETESNASGIVNGGGSDAALTQNGLSQLEDTGKKLSDIRFDAVYCSPLGRTKASAHKVMSYNKAWDGDIQIVDGLADIYLGKAEGKTLTDIVNEYGMSALYTGKSNDSNFKSKISAESTYNFIKRYKKTMNNIVGSREVHNKTILVVAHSSATYWIREATGDKNAEMLKNAEVIKLTYKNGKWYK